MTAHDLASALGGTKKGQHYWALCPAHEYDNRKHRPSLKISEGRTVPVLVKCWASCSQQEVIGRLKQLGLWSMPTLTIQERRTHAREQAERETAVLDLEDYLGCLDRLKLHAEEFTDTWEALCREQRDVRREIEALGGPLEAKYQRSFRDVKVIHPSRTMAAKA